jgi:hypothetical protein
VCIISITHEITENNSKKIERYLEHIAFIVKLVYGGSVVFRGGLKS